MITDLRLASRSLVKSPAFTFVAVATLALGIGANTAIFSVVNALLLSPLPYHEPERLVGLSTRNAGLGTTGAGFAPVDFRTFESQVASIDPIVAARYDYVTLTGVQTPTQVTGGLVTVDYFRLLGRAPLIGRTFVADDLRPDRTPPVVVSQQFWEANLGGRREAVGEVIALDGTPHTLVGVMPASFKEPFNVAGLWRLVPATGGENAVSTARMWGVMGRLKPGVSIDAASAEATTIQARMLQDNPSFHEGWEIVVTPLRDVVVGSYRKGLFLLIGASALVLLITCANVAGLMLVRAAARLRESAIRTALGAGRLRLMAQQLTESMVLLALGCAGGIVLGGWGLDLLLASMPQGWLPRGDEVRLSMPVLVTCAATAILVGQLFSLLPAWHASRVDAGDALKDGSKGTHGSAARRTRGALVVGQIALAIVLLTAAGLVIKSLGAILGTNPGLKADNVLSMVLNIPTTRYDTTVKQVEYYREIVDRTRSIPGVDAVALTQTMPFTWGIRSPFSIVGRPDDTARLPQPIYDSVTPSYFQTMGIPLLAGRGFAETDTVDSQRVILVSQSLARRFFPDTDPIGQRMELVGARAPVQMEIIGVVGDVPRDGLNAEVPYQIYASFTQRTFPFATLLVRSAQPVETLTSTIRGEIHRLNPDQPISQVATVRTLMRNTVAQPRLYTVIFAFFAGLALLLSAVGLYGLVSYSVVQRTREIGIRAALGAQSGDVLRLVLGQGLRLTIAGLGIGIVGALLTVRLMQGLVYKVSTHDPSVFAAVVLLLPAVALLAAFFPARRAARVDPMEALRNE